MIFKQIAARTMLWMMGGLLVGLIGCGPEDPSAADRPLTPDDGAGFSLAERDSVLALLDGIRQDAFRSAFARLPNYHFTRYTRTEQFDEDDFLVAFRERVARHRYDGTAPVRTVTEADSAGTFEYGFFNQFVSENVDAADPVDLVPFVLPEDPPYRTPRNHDRYGYRLRPDTLLWDAAARVIEIRALPEEGDGLNIRRVRLYIDRATDELVAMYLERIDLAMLFREESQFYLHIRQAPDGAWVPYNARFHTLLRTPFQPTRQFRTVSTYYDYEPVG